MNRHRTRLLAMLVAIVALLAISAPGAGQVGVKPIATIPVNLTTQTTGTLALSRLAVPLVIEPGGRLTLTTATPITTGDVTSASTVYYTASASGVVPVSDGSTCQLLTFSEISIALSSLTSGANYDVFVKSSAGTATLELSAAWSSDTARSDAIARDTVCPGLQVKSSAHTRTWVGTIRTTGTTTTEDSKAKRFVWNTYRRTPRMVQQIETTGSWSYSSTTLRQARATATNQVEWVTGDAATLVDVALGALSSSSSNTPFVDIGLDSTTAGSAQVRQPSDAISGAAVTSSARYQGQPGLGYHRLVWLESVNAGSVTFFGTDVPGLVTGNGAMTGLVGLVF